MNSIETNYNSGEQTARIAELEQRLKQLAAAKSQLQLYANLINRLSLVKGLDNVSSQLVSLLMGTLGGTNITLYYSIDNVWHSVDATKTKAVLEDIPGGFIRDALVGRENIFLDAKTDTHVVKGSSLGRFYQGATWIIPMILESLTVGVIVMEGMIVVRPDMMEHLKPFINYASMVLKSEIENYSELKLAYNSIKVINKELSKEIEERKNAERDLRESEKLFRSTFENTVVGMCMTSVDGRFLKVNSALCQMLGYSEKELLNRRFVDVTHPDDVVASYEKIRLLLENKTRLELFEKRYLQKSGQVLWVMIGTSLLRDAQNTPQYFITHIEDVTSRKLAEEKLKANEAKFRTLFEHVTDFAVVFEPSERGLTIVDLNDSACKHHGYAREEMIGQDISFLDLHPIQPDDQRFRKILSGEVVTFEASHRRKDGSIFPVEVTSKLIDVEGTPFIFCIERNIASRKKAENDKALLERQLIQAQKMEAVGQLAGGVAHDFNNMLGVILGHAEMAMEQIEASHPVSADLVEIRKAAERSADITRQLLAFARKQTIAPKVIDLNETIEGMLKMLRRLIGENIDLVWLPGASLWPVKIDPSQIDQILANLCVNARAAIAGVGKITVETGNETFDEQYCAAHQDFVAGEYVRITVGDNGSGMDRRTLDHIFEPFFTTKGVGEGTGLGLATVYGSVKQNNGMISVTSEPGRGTAFQIYLPRHAGNTAQVRPEEEAPVPCGKETILLVEDEPSILSMTSLMLQGLGYTVLTATTPREAIGMVQGGAWQIHLLLTDVVMPEMNGHELAQKLLPRSPQLKCLFMSGYTADIITRQGVLVDGVQFIQKPFSKKDLAAKVRIALENNGKMALSSARDRVSAQDI